MTPPGTSALSPTASPTPARDGTEARFSPGSFPGFGQDSSLETVEEEPPLAAGVLTPPPESPLKPPLTIVTVILLILLAAANPLLKPRPREEEVS